MATPTGAWSLQDRVTLEGKGNGTIVFIDQTEFATGIWYGVVLDQPNGKNNGSVKGMKYFECEENHGVFVKENQLLPVTGSKRGSLAGSTLSLQSTTSSQDDKTQSGIAAKNLSSRPSLSDLKASGLPPPSKLASQLKAPAPKAAQPVPASKAKDATQPSVKPAASTVSAKDGKDSKEKVESSKSTQPQKPAAPKESSPVAPEMPKRDSIDLGKEASASDTAGPTVEMERRPEIRESIELAKIKRDYEMEIGKLQMQIEQLEYNKSHLQQINGDLQSRLQNAEQEIRELKDAADLNSVQELQDMVDELTVDKECAEELRDKAERDLEELKLKYDEAVLDLETLKHQVESGGSQEVVTNFRVDELEKMNEQLRDALLKLRNMSTEDKQTISELQKKEKQMETEVHSLTTKNKSLMEVNAKNTELLADMREQLEASLGAEEMVEKLAEKKLLLEEKVEELEKAANDYEELMQMNNEIIELNSKKERQFLEQIDILNGEISSHKLKLSELDRVVSESNATLLKYRDLTGQLGEENANLRTQLQQQQSSAQNPVPVAPVPIDFRLKAHDEKLVAKRIEHKLVAISEKLLRKNLEYICHFMPDVYWAGREESFVRVSLLPEELCSKVALMQEEAAEKFELYLYSDETKFVACGTHQKEQLIYAANFQFSSSRVLDCARDIQFAVQFATPQVFAVMSELEGPLQKQTDSLLYYIDLLKQSRMDETIALDHLRDSAATLKELSGRLVALGGTARQGVDKLLDLLEAILWVARAIQFSVTLLKEATVNSDSDVVSWLQELARRSREIQDAIRKIKRPLETDNDLRSVVLPSSVITFLSESLDELQTASTLCYQWSRTVGHELSVLAVDQQSGVIDFSRMRNLLYAENDKGKFYKNAAVSPQQSMMSAMEKVATRMGSYVREINDGEWVKNAAKLPESPKHPLRSRAEAMKKLLADAEELKHKLAQKDEEILEVKKALRSKAEEISELQLRLDMSGRKLETASKSVEDRSAKLQQQVNELTNRLQSLQMEYEAESMRYKTTVERLEMENKALERKLEQAGKNFLSVGISPAKGAGKAMLRAAGGGDYDGQVDVLRQLVSSLRAEVVATKAAQVQKDLDEKLPPLNVYSGVKRDPNAERLKKLQRDLDGLKMERGSIMARTALDLTVSLEERERTMRLRKKLEEDLRLKVAKIKAEMADLRSPGMRFQEFGEAYG